MTEEYILWHDWHWVTRKCEFISQSIREARRWDLMSRLSASIGRSGGKEGMEYWQSLFDATITAAEKAEQQEAEEREVQRILEEQREERRKVRMAGRRISGM